MLKVSRTLKVLNLSKCKLDTAVATSIFRSLEHNTSLEELDLSENSQLAKNDSEAVGCAIERMLNVNRTLKVLNLGVHEVTDPVVKHILTGLIKNMSLKNLYIGSCTLSVKCAVPFLQQITNYPSLSISAKVSVQGVGEVKMDRETETLWCVVGDIRDTVPENCVEFFRALNDTGMKVSKLNVQDLTDRTAECFAVGLAESQTIQALKLIRSIISSAGAVSIFRSLEHNTSLKKLDLSQYSQLAEGDTEAVGCAIERMLNVNRTLNVLNLSCCNVPDPVVKHILTGLTKNTSLVTLNMNVQGVGGVKMVRETLWCVVGDICDTVPENCVEFFRALNDTGMKVSKLNVQDLTDQTTEDFAVGLAESQSVQALKLKHCNISSTSAVSIFRSLEHNTSLEELDLSWNIRLAEGDSEAVGCAIERMLKLNTALKILNLIKCGLDTAVATSIFKSLEHNTSLVKLELSESSQLAKVDSEAVGCAIERMLKLNTALKILNLRKCGLDTAVATSIFKSLEHNTSLVKLDLSKNSQLAKVDSEAVGCAIERMLKLNRTLKVLNLSGCKVTDPVVKHIVTGLTKNMSLKNLYVGSFTLSVKCAVPFLQQMITHPSISTEVNVLGLGRVNMERESICTCVISKMVPEKCVEFFRALNDNGVKVSMLNVQDLTDQTTEHFAVGLAESQSVQALKVEHCNISSAGPVSIFRSLEHNTSLEELDLSGNIRLAEGDSEAVGCAIERMLNMNSTLKVLNLHNCGLETTHIAAGLTHNSSLAELDISNVDKDEKEEDEFITNEGCIHLFKALHSNTSLKKLDISYKLGIEESVALAEMLSCNKTLIELTLRECDIPEAGLREIARGVLLNSSLQTLKFGNTQYRYLIDEQGFDPLCIDNGHLDLAKFLSIVKYCDQTSRNSCGETPIHRAVQYGHLEILKFFIADLKCSPNTPGQHGGTPLHYAAEKGHLHIMKYLIDEQGCDPSCLDSDKQTSLHLAAANGQLDIVKFLTLEKHCNPTSRNSSGATPIHATAQCDHLEILKFFITDLKCSPNTPGQHGGTPLHYAAEKGYLHIMKYLIDEQECDPSCLDKKEQTPLHCAARNAQLGIVKFLTLEKHCNMNQRNILNNPPLHSAAVNGHLQVVQFFVEELKCPPNTRGHHNATPHQLAEIKGHHNVALYLQKFQHSTDQQQWLQ